MLNPNCSELVVQLKLTEAKDIKKALKKIEEVTGWEVSLHKAEYKDKKILHKHKRIPIDQVTKYRVRIGINKKKLTKEDEKEYIEKWDLVHGTIIPLVLFDSKTNGYVDISVLEGYSNTYGLNFQAEQHCVKRDFPILAEILRLFPDSHWATYDGGSSKVFGHWLLKKGYKKELMREKNSTEIHLEYYSECEEYVKHSIWEEKLIEQISTGKCTICNEEVFTNINDRIYSNIPFLNAGTRYIKKDEEGNILLDITVEKDTCEDYWEKKKKSLQ